MKSFVLAVIGVFSAAQMGLGCVDATLKTNTDPRNLWRIYYDLKFPNSVTPATRRQCPEHGATELRVPKEACFWYPVLRSQNDIPCLAPLIRKYNALPKTKWRVTTLRDGKPVVITVHMVGTGTHQTVLICIPGVMSNAAEFRFMVGALADDYDFWLIDPPGCGDSEAPDPKTLGPGGYSPAAMAERELQAIDNCLTECRRPARALIVAHSLGGLVALRAFADPDLRARYGQVLGYIEGLVLLAPCDVFVSQANQDLASRAELSGLKINIGHSLGIVQEAVAQYLALSFYASHCLAREEVDHAVKVLTHAGTRNAFQAMLREVLPYDQKTRRFDFPQMLLLETWYTNVSLPCEIIWGKCDQTLSVAMGYMLERQLPNARLTVMPDCKHAPNLECPRECARLIREADRQIAANTLAAQRLATRLP